MQRQQVSPAIAGSAIAAGVSALLLIVGISIGIALADDPDWFFVIGGPGQLLWLIGTIGLGVQIWKARVFPRWTAIGSGLSVPFGIIGSEVGLTAVVGVTWLVLGFKLLELSRLPALREN